MLDGRTHRIEVEPGALIIEEARCCICHCKAVEGEVVMDVNYSLEPWELEAGYVLACQSRPLTAKVTLDFDAA